MYDVCIVGAGVIGCSIARELSRYEGKVCILEKMSDVAEGASKANSGIVHGGFSEKAGSLKSELCIQGNRLYEQLNKELNFGYRKLPSLVIGFTDDDAMEIKKLYDNGIKYGLEGLDIIYADRIKELEPHINKDVKIALYCENSGVTSPYELTIALAENSIENGVELKLNTEVIAIEKIEDHFKITTNNGEFEAKYVVNAAGVFSDKIANMVGIDDFYIKPRKGQYVLLDKDQGYLAQNVIFQIPTKVGKGILVTKTYFGNLMIGPNAEEGGAKDDVSTTEDILKYIVETARISIPDLDMKKAITSFSGVRPTSSKGDFIIEESKVPGFINVAGIESPGLTSSPIIGKKVVEILEKAGHTLKDKPDFNPYRKPIVKLKDENFKGYIDAPTPEENIICRCESVTEAEIIDALHRAIPIKSTQGVKRRTRAGMGRCQGAFCQPRVTAIIARELGIPVEEVVQKGKGSSFLPERVKTIKKL